MNEVLCSNHLCKRLSRYLDPEDAHIVRATSEHGVAYRHAECCDGINCGNPSHIRRKY